MKAKLIALGVFAAVMAVFAARVPLAQADPFSDTFNVKFVACTVAGPNCPTPGTITAGSSMSTTIHTSLDSPGGSFYDSVRTVSTGIAPQSVGAGLVVGNGQFSIHLAVGHACSVADAAITPSYTIYSSADPASPPAYPVLGYAKGLKAPETWANFSSNWIADFDDDNLNNIPDFLEPGQTGDGSTLPMTVRDLHGPGGVGGPDGILDGAQLEPLYLQPLDIIEGQTHNFRAIGDAVVVAGASEVPVDFVTYTNMPAAGENMQLAIIGEGSGVNLLPSNNSASSISTCAPFTSDITLNGTTPGGAAVQLATASGSYSFQLSTADDYDGDGVANYQDNCDTVPNASQTDTNGDGIGDACQPAGLPAAVGDFDGDGFPNYADSCPAQKNTVDSDGDGVDNACDTAPSVVGNGAGYAGGYIDHDAIQTVAFTLPMAAAAPTGNTINGTEQIITDSNDNHVADSAETAGDLVLGSGLKPGDSDGDGILDSADPDALNPGGRIGKCGADCGHDAAFPNVYGDGCDDATEVTLSINGIPMTNSPWAYYNVPSPSLFANPNPTSSSGYRKSGSLSSSGAQAVFGYFKQGAVLGTVLYNQDLNKNNVMDGVEYDRKVSGAGQTAGPDGIISSGEAQKAFSEFKAGITCSLTAGYKMDDSTWFNGGNP